MGVVGVTLLGLPPVPPLVDCRQVNCQVNCHRVGWPMIAVWGQLPDFYAIWKVPPLIQHTLSYNTSTRTLIQTQNISPPLIQHTL